MGTIRPPCFASSSSSSSSSSSYTQIRARVLCDKHMIYRMAHEMSYHFIIPLKLTSQYRCCKRASECCSSWKMRQMSPVCKMADNGRLTVDQNVKVVLFYAETKSVVATQRRFRAHFSTRWVPCQQAIYRLSLGKIFQPMRISSVSDVKCFYNNRNVLCVHSMVWHFVRHPVCDETNFHIYKFYARA